MFNLNTNDPDVLWLVLTNWTLFAVTAICIGVALYGIGVEVKKRYFRRADDHALATPELGFTMADGGESVRKRRGESR